MDTQMQNFWVEAIKKEESMRFAWQLKYSKTFAKQARKKKAEDDSAAKKGVAITDPLTNVKSHIKRMEDDLEKDKDKQSARSSQSKKREDKKKKRDDADDLSSSLEEKKMNLLKVREMRSPSPKTKMQLYDGISHHGEGRYAYLKLRNRKSPEQKYIFPVLSSNNYGWKIHDHLMPKSEYARTRIIRDTFYRHSGIITG